MEAGTRRGRWARLEAAEAKARFWGETPKATRAQVFQQVPHASPIPRASQPTFIASGPHPHE